MEADPFDGLLDLEEKFYDDGHRLGIEDGRRAGLIEGRFFGLEKGFEKYAAMGRLHGRSVVWAGRLLPSSRDIRAGKSTAETSSVKAQDQASTPLEADSMRDTDEGACLEEPYTQGFQATLPPLPGNPRLEKHIRTLYALVEPSSLSTANNEDSVSEFDDRLKRAEGKVRIIEKFIGDEKNDAPLTGPSSSSDGAVGPKMKAGDGGIEDISVLHARH